MAIPLPDVATASAAAMEAAFYAADPAWDGRFVAAVRTTGIFCRPSCHARKPKPENVVYLRTAAEARARGYRPCLRCHPEAARAVVSRTLDTPLGPMLAAAGDAGVCLLDFVDRPMLPAQLAAVSRRVGTPRPGTHPLLDRLASQLDEYFAGTRRDFDLPLDVPGSAFAERVWSELRQIPYGETVSYGELAARVAAPRGSRAVGRANGANRVAIVIPCHRVIAADGGLGGYGGGLERKRFLLDLEAASA